MRAERGQTVTVNFRAGELATLSACDECNIGNVNSNGDSCFTFLVAKNS